jgi:hypothetical protein
MYVHSNRIQEAQKRTGGGEARPGMLQASPIGASRTAPWFGMTAARADASLFGVKSGRRRRAF